MGNFPEGISKSKTAIMKLLLLTALATVALAEPEADAYYGYGGYYGHGLYGYGYGHQLGWPTYRAPGFESTVWGARGKRSAEPSAEPHGYGFYGYHPYAYGLYHPYAFRHHVAAVAAPEGTGVGVHPGGATSFVSRSPQGLGKRSAEEAAPAEDDKVYGSGHNSYVGQTVWGFPKVKRSAEEVEAVAEEAAAPAAHVAVAHPTLLTTATNLDGPHSVLPVSPPLSGAPVERGPLKLNLDTVIMATPPTVDIMD